MSASFIQRGNTEEHATCLSVPKLRQPLFLWVMLHVSTTTRSLAEQMSVITVTRLHLPVR